MSIWAIICILIALIVLGSWIVQGVMIFLDWIKRVDLDMWP